MRALLVILVAAGALVSAAPAADRPVGGHDPGWDDSARAWSPDGTRIAYGREWIPAKDRPDYGYGIVGVSGHPAHLLGKTFDDVSEADPAWSPDGTRLVFSRRIGDDCGCGGGNGPGDLFLAGPDGGAQRNATRTPEDSETDPAWAPDGSAISYSRKVGDGNVDLWLMQPDGSAPHRLIADGRDAQWSPDGSLLTFLRDGGSSLERWVIKANGSGARRIYGQAELEHVLWSPDSSRIAYFVYHEKPGTFDTLVVNADGTGKHRVADGKDDSALAWAPGGDELLVERGRNSGKPALSLVDATTGAERRLTDGSNGSYSPGGGLIAFDRGAAEGDKAPLAIYVMRPDGSGVRRIARGVYGPIWSPDGARLAATGADPCLGSGVYVVAVATRVASRLTNDCRVVGTNGPDHLAGTSELDVIRGLGGNDVIDANPGDAGNVFYDRVDDDLVDAGAGNDVVYARRGTDVVLGGPGNDRLYGGRGADTLTGGPGNDVLDGGPYLDRLSGGPGNDLVLARDGFKDRISCGPGSDTVQADSRDVVARDCEHVVRR